MGFFCLTTGIYLPSQTIKELLKGLSFSVDHFYLASNGSETYVQLRDHIVALGGTMIREGKFKGRWLSVVTLEICGETLLNWSGSKYTLRYRVLVMKWKFGKLLFRPR